MTRRLLALTTVLAALGLAVTPAVAHNEGIPSVPVSQLNMVHVQNVPSLVGNNMDFFERRQADGTVKRYLVSANTAYGLDILEITDPDHPTVVGRYTGPDGANPANTTNYGWGINNHAWVSVNPRRNIVALSIEEQAAVVQDGAGHATRHGGGVGLQFVDISDVTNPRPLGQPAGSLGGPHTNRMIGDNCNYTSLDTHIIDYTNPNAPTARAGGSFQGHEFWEDPNIPGRAYVGMATALPRWGVADVSNCLNPFTISEKGDPSMSVGGTGRAHEVYPAPDSSYVGVADFKNGQTTVACPGGGIHFWDITGKHKAGASLSNPIKMGTYFIPFAGTLPNSTANHASCTTHGWNMHPERELALAAMYSAGTFVIDPSHATQAGGAYTEFTSAERSTTWGNTVGNVRDAADYANVAMWLPFDLANPEHEKYVFVNGATRGLDIYKYTPSASNPLPKKLSRITISSSAAGGTVTGKLERYAVLTHEGWRNKPLAGQTVDVTAGGTTVQAVTAADGSFSANLGLGAGAHSVTVSWAGDDVFAARTATQTVSA